VLLDDGLKSHFDVFAFGFRSNLREGSLSVPKAAALFNEQLEAFPQILKYRRIVIVAHSMGGLIAIQALSQNKQLLRKVPLILTLGSPLNGAGVASLVNKVIPDGGLRSMIPQEEYIEALQNNWRDRKLNEGVQTIVRCAYETLPLLNRGIIVTRESASFLCDGSAVPMIGDHLALTKPTAHNRDGVNFVKAELLAFGSRGPLRPRVLLVDSRVRAGVLSELHQAVRQTQPGIEFEIEDVAVRSDWVVQARELGQRFQPAAVVVHWHALRQVFQMSSQPNTAAEVALLQGLHTLREECPWAKIIIYSRSFKPSSLPNARASLSSAAEKLGGGSFKELVSEITLVPLSDEKPLNPIEVQYLYDAVLKAVRDSI
jgi:pimeloyl-ACP methyl ester carboxylesterase